MASQTGFFYGLFMDSDLLGEKGFNPEFVCLAYLDGYQLAIGERATLIRSEGKRSYGVIIKVPEEELAVLYREPSVRDYKPCNVSPHSMSGQKIESVTYLLPEQHLAGKNTQYAERLSQIAQKLGLPQHYIEEINTWI